MKLEALLDDEGLAAILGVTPETVQRWRYGGHGPRFIRISNRVRYRPVDVQAWLESRPSGGSVA